jgi:hypothetical protein
MGDGVDPKDGIRQALQTAKDGGIRNIVALRGDPPAGQDTWVASEGGFTCALDLVVFMREEFGSDFGISVAGYPEGHPNAITEIEDPSTMTAAEAARSSNCDGKTFTCKDEDYKKEMDYLKKKIDAGSGMLLMIMILVLLNLYFANTFLSAHFLFNNNTNPQTLSLPKCFSIRPSLFNSSRTAAPVASIAPSYPASCA